ncbi:MAG: flagellar motor switch protein FliN [Beijerinckiaceae bacterium]
MLDQMDIQSEAEERDWLAVDHVMGIPVTLDVIVGSAQLPISSLMKMSKGTVIPLDRKIGEPVEIAVNGRVVAKGEVVVLDDDPSQLGISLIEVKGSR